MHEFELIKKFFLRLSKSNKSSLALNDDVFFDKKKSLVISPICSVICSGLVVAAVLVAGVVREGAVTSLSDWKSTFWMPFTAVNTKFQLLGMRLAILVVEMASNLVIRPSNVKHVVESERLYRLKCSCGFERYAPHVMAGARLYDIHVNPVQVVEPKR